MGPVWRFTVRQTDGLQTTIACGPVNRAEKTLSVELSLQMTLPMPHQDEHLPDRIESLVHHAGLEVQRRLFRALIEKADQELVLQRRHGKGGDGYPAAGHAALYLQDHLRRGHRPTLSDLSQPRRHGRGALGGR